jgi:uncharacterized protein YdaU (DUF1376 family)
MPSLPWVKWYSSKWLSSPTRMAMSPLQRCVYLELLFCTYEGGGRIPSDKQQLARMAMVTLDELETAWPAVSKHFVPCEDDPTMLTNLVALGVMGEQAPYHDAKVAAGRKGGAASGISRRKQRSKKEAEDEAIEERRDRGEIEKEQDSVSESVSGSSFLKTSNHASQMEELMEQFIAAYPRKEGLAATRRAYDAVIKTPDEHSALMAGLARWLESRQWKQDGGRYIPLAAKFIRERLWEETPQKEGDSVDEELRRLGLL